MTLFRLAMAFVRSAVIGLIAYASIRGFLGTSAADALSGYIGRMFSDKGQMVLGLLPASQVQIWVVAGIVGIPGVACLFSRERRSVAWLGGTALLLQAPGVLSHSRLDWWRYLDESFANSAFGRGPSLAESTASLIGTLCGLLILLVVHDLQQDVRRLQRGRYQPPDVTRFVYGHAASTLGVIAAAAALSALTLALTWLIAGALPMSLARLPWALVGIGMIAVAVLSAIVYLFAGPSSLERSAPTESVRG